MGKPPVNTGGLPIFLVQGEADGMALPVDGWATYQAVSAPPKAYVGLTGANHYSVTNVDNPPGAQAEGSPATLDRTIGHDTIAKWMGCFLRAELLGDEAAGALVYGSVPHDDPNVNAHAAMP
jgi:hypothetical protein